MEPEAAILEWIKPASIKAGGGGDLWQSGMAPETWFIRPDTNKDFDDKIFQPESYDFIKVDDQYYFNNSGVYLIVDNTVKKPSGTQELMRLEIHNLSGYWIIQPYINPFPETGIIADQVQLTQLREDYEWKDFAKALERNPSHWDIYYLIEYLGNRFRPLNWTHFPDSLL